MSCNKSGVVLQGRAREIIYRVHKVFESEKHQAKELLRKLSNATIYESSNGTSTISISSELFSELTEFLKASARVTERVVMSTGVNKNTVSRIKREGGAAELAGTCKITTPVRKPRGKSVVLNNHDLYALSNLITKLYEEGNDIPSLSKILAKARSDLNFQGSMSTLRRILIQHLRYKYTRGCDRSKQISIIRPDIGSNNEDLETEYLETATEEVETQGLITQRGSLILASRTTSTGISINDDAPIEMENPYKKEQRLCILCKLNIMPDYKNYRLLSQFQSPYTGRIYGRHITGLCKNKQLLVEAEIKKAQNCGYMPYYYKDKTFLKDPKLFDPENPIRSHNY